MALSLDRAVELYESRRYASMACDRCPWPTKTHEYAPCTQVEPLVGHTTHNAQADEGRVEPDEGQRGDLRLVKQLWERCTLIMNPRGLYDRITSVARAFTRTIVWGRVTVVAPGGATHQGHHGRETVPDAL